jgi:ion channel
MSRIDLIVAYRRHRFGVLFYSLLLTLGAGPLLAAFDVNRNYVRIFLELNLFAAVFSVANGRRWRALRLGLVAVVTLRLVVLSVEDHPLAIATRPLIILIGLGAAVAALRFALRTRRVDDEHVYAALSAYLLAGIFAGLLYFEIETIWPGSFTSNGTPIPHFTLATAVYFSFVTLATLGYGDIVPQSEVARGVTVVEAIAGQLYLAVLVARLIGVYASPYRGA